ncbi:F510_1955 family glycosylhydrolase [Streptomyces albogriseolus]|uniref:F510_1955 family glycosylhydrolase n=1 Tax=Streptomyces albogriseolus TaxID=1887 RepID=UPI0037A628A7
MRKQYFAIAASAALALTLTACSGDGESGEARTSSSSTVSHIHGVGIDPADDRLYVATHEGVFTPGENNEPQRVGDSRDDYMGFTVAKARTFLASGHPAPGAEGPGNKGLIESTDAGETWTTKSLSGDVDFHALEYTDGTIYGYDSTNGKVRVSEDGVKWQDRATLPALDIAVHPDDTQMLLATTEAGVAKSTDGGKTFAEGAEPVLHFVSWGAPDAAYGIDGSGALHRSTDSGDTWKKVGTAPGGRPQALTAVGAERVLVATQDGVYESKNGGKTFTGRMDVASTGGH